MGQLTGLELRASNIHISYRGIFSGTKAHKYRATENFTYSKL